MIALVSGNVIEKFVGSLVIDVRGIGYEVVVPLSDYEAVSINDNIKLHTYHHIREQSQDLFGFRTLAAKRLFELLITVQGVGPKAGIAVMSIADSEVVRSAIVNSDVAFITKAVGVGKKTAERVVVDLRDKVGVPATISSGSVDTLHQTVASDEALEALMALGFNLQDASEALKDVPTNLPTSQRVTMALKQ
ncbi:Holliday junction branch migration protein RuvA [Candidatus Saccharibacteria bacterium]|jgi:Holliday junction DNA helicase RuvA|nr:Holliday junction branch migration protein RuvA [Candidatus Saccharibacteria bacterium]